MKNDSLLRISAKFQRENGFWLLAIGYWLLRSHKCLKTKHSKQLNNLNTLNPFQPSSTLFQPYSTLFNTSQLCELCARLCELCV